MSKAYRDDEGYLVFPSQSIWRAETAYSTTTVVTSKSQADIQRLLIDDFEAEEVIISERQNGQVAVAFRWQGQGYVIPVRRAKIKGETVAQVAQLKRQVMRVLHWYLKNLLMMRFLTSTEELLMPHQMLQGNMRVADAVLSGDLRLALPSGEDSIEGEARTL